MVGVEGFEPPTYWSQTSRASRTALYPDRENRYDTAPESRYRIKDYFGTFCKGLVSHVEGEFCGIRLYPCDSCKDSQPGTKTIAATVSTRRDIFFRHMIYQNSVLNSS